MTLDQIWMYAVEGNPDEWKSEPQWMDADLAKAQLLANWPKDKPLPKPRKRK